MVDEIRQGLYRIKARGYITDIPNIRIYISPYAERVDNETPPEGLVDQIISQYIKANESDNEEEDSQLQATLTPISGLYSFRGFTYPSAV